MNSNSAVHDVRDEVEGNTTKPLSNNRGFGINIGPYEDPEFLTLHLLTYGTIASMIGLGAPIFDPDPCSKASLVVSVAYMVCLLVVFLYGLGLVGLSYWLPQAPVSRVGILKTAAPIPIRRARIAKAWMSKLFVPVVVAVFLGFVSFKLRKPQHV